MTIRVYLVDDHALVRTGMKMILSGETDIEVVGEAETGEDALRDVRQLLPDVVLCDLHLPGVSGMEVTERIVRSHRNTRVVIVSVLEDGPLPKRLLGCGLHRQGLRCTGAAACGARCGHGPSLPGHQHRAEPGLVDR